jgi:hypothetical protein
MDAHRLQVHIEHWKGQSGLLLKVREELAGSRMQCEALAAAEHKDSRLIANLQEKLLYTEAVASSIVTKEASFRREVRGLLSGIPQLE